MVSEVFPNLQPIAQRPKSSPLVPEKSVPAIVEVRVIT